VDEIPAPLIYKQAIDARNPDREEWLTAEEGALEAKQNARATAAEAAEQATLEDRLQQGGRTSVKCAVTIGELPCTSWGGRTTKGISESDERRCCCSTCSHERRGDAAAVAADTSPDLPDASSTSLPSDSHASTMKAFSTVAQGSDEARAFVSRHTRRRTTSIAAGSGDAFTFGQYGVVDTGANLHLMYQLIGDYEVPCVDEKSVEMGCELRRGLYGIKQNGFLWSQCFRSFMCSTNGKSSGLTEEGLWSTASATST